MSVDLKDLVAELRRLKEDKARLEAELSQVETDKVAIEEQIVAALINSGMNSAKFPGIGTVSYSIQKYPSIANKDLFYKYLRDTDQADLIKETVNANTLRGWFNSLESEVAAIEIGLNIFEKTGISLRK